MAFPRVLTGARAILKMNNEVTVFATDVSYVLDTEFKAINEIDNSLPNELAPGQINVSVIVTNLRVSVSSSASIAQIQPTILNNMSQPYTSIELKDRATNETILYVPQALMTKRSGKTSKRALSTETWTFTGIGFWDERTPAMATEEPGPYFGSGGVVVDDLKPEV